jgi:hypothetical protein
VVQSEGPEFNPQYCKNKTNKKKGDFILKTLRAKAPEGIEW